MRKLEISHACRPKLWALVAHGHSLRLGRDSGGLTDFAGRVWRCTFRWRERTAALLFCHLTFWWGDVSTAAGGLCCGGSVLRRSPAVLGFTLTPATGNWTRPSLAVGARTVTRQSYCVTQSPSQLSLAPSTVTQDTLLWNTPRAWYSFNILFLFVCLFYCSFCLFVCFLNVSYLQS